MAKMEHIYTLERMKEWSKDLSDDEIEAIAYALKTLNQEPCEDAVSRAEVIDELNRLGRNAFKDDTDYDNFFAFLDSLPSVTPTQEWIPCSDRLPEETGLYLITFKAYGGGYAVTLLYYEKPKNYWTRANIYQFGNDEVVAWMPLPKPYEQKDKPNKDCEHCSKTYGTLGCCDFVNNKLVYSCENEKRGSEE